MQNYGAWKARSNLAGLNPSWRLEGQGWEMLACLAHAGEDDQCTGGDWQRARGAQGGCPHRDSHQRGAAALGPTATCHQVVPWVEMVTEWFISLKDL